MKITDAQVATFAKAVYHASMDATASWSARRLTEWPTAELRQRLRADSKNHFYKVATLADDIAAETGLSANLIHGAIDETAEYLDEDLPIIAMTYDKDGNPGAVYPELTEVVTTRCREKLADLAREVTGSTPTPLPSSEPNGSSAGCPSSISALSQTDHP